jgi:hypothetical protein
LHRRGTIPAAVRRKRVVDSADTGPKGPNKTKAFHAETLIRKTPGALCRGLIIIILCILLLLPFELLFKGGNSFRGIGEMCGRLVRLVFRGPADPFDKVIKRVLNTSLVQNLFNFLLVLAVF